jgi:hypothetical protein
MAAFPPPLKETPRRNQNDFLMKISLTFVDALLVDFDTELSTDYTHYRLIVRVRGFVIA